MVEARRERINERCNEVVVSTASDQSTMESIVSAQHGLQTVHQVVQTTNIALLKIWSIFVSKTRKVLCFKSPHNLLSSCCYLFFVTFSIHMLQISNQCIFFFISYYFHIILVKNLVPLAFLFEKIDPMKNMGFGP